MVSNVVCHFCRLPIRAGLGERFGVSLFPGDSIVGFEGAEVVIRRPVEMIAPGVGLLPVEYRSVVLMVTTRDNPPGRLIGQQWDMKLVDVTGVQ